MPRELESWIACLIELAGDVRAAHASEPVALQPDHYGFLVFLLSQIFENEDQALLGLRASPIFRFSFEKGRLLFKDLRERGLVVGAAPTTEAQELVMQSPYAPYVSAVREVSR